jgi:hypothetical protein
MRPATDLEVVEQFVESVDALHNVNLVSWEDIAGARRYAVHQQKPWKQPDFAEA